MSDTQRTAVITGATSEQGIGIAVARRYAREGWAVVVLDLDGEKSAKVAADIGNQFAVPAYGYAIDVTSEDSVAAAHQVVAAEVVATARLTPAPEVEVLAPVSVSFAAHFTLDELTRVWGLFMIKTTAYF